MNLAVPTGSFSCVGSADVPGSGSGRAPRAPGFRAPPVVGALVAWLAAVCLLAGGVAQAFDEKQWHHPRPTHDFAQKTYYRVVRPDPRLCPSPVCGGFFVEAVNRRVTRCADGSKGKECHAALVDLSALGLSAEEETQVLADFASKRTLLRGRLSVRDSGFGIDVPVLSAAAAWRGVTGTQPERGRYIGVVPSGIVCITYPCPTLQALPLNVYRRAWFHGLDLDPSGASPSEIGEAFEEIASGPGLIVFATEKRVITGPGGKGFELVGAEFYQQVVSGSGPFACGGFTYPPNPPCASGEFCELPAGTCQIADLPGTCQEIPDACPAVVDPVCGCDGRTYGNDCERRRARVALDHPGPCFFPPEPCGANTCTGGTTCCNPLLGICTPPGVACIQ